MQSKKTFLAAVALSFAAAAPANELIYDNGVNYLGYYLNPGTNRVGDEIILGGTYRTAFSFEFQYYGNNFHTGGITNEQFRVQFLNNDGSLLGGSTYLPNSVFYDSGWQNLAAPITPTGVNNYYIDLSSLSLVLPEHFTWTVQFQGIDAGEIAGVSLFDPPVVGNNFDDYWFDNGTTWELRGTNGIPISFGAQVTAVPEPSTYVLAILGGLCGFALVSRRKRSSR
jgi:hypothetical protein